ARREWSQDFRRGDPERSEVLNQSAELTELAQARAEELDPDRDADDQPGDPLEAIEPVVDAIHEVDAVLHVLSAPSPEQSMIGVGRLAIFYCDEQDSDVEDRPERLKHDKDAVIDEERMREEQDCCATPANPRN